MREPLGATTIFHYSMTSLDLYKSFEEKGEYFYINRPIETIEDLDNLWIHFESFEKGFGLSYRGVKNSGYKLYNTFQRMWITHNLENYRMKYEDLIESFLKTSKIQSPIKDLLKAEHDDLGTLSIMQHYYMPDNGYSQPTPLLDLTFNPFIALYFAFEPSAKENISSELDKYCSVYSVNIHNVKLQGYQNLFYAFIQNEAGNKITYKSINLPSLFHLHTDDDYFQVINNQRIKNQEGLFFMMNDSDFPLEKRLKLDIDFAVAEGRLPKKTSSKVFLCHDINKNLRQYALNRLEKEKGIFHSFVYPD